MQNVEERPNILYKSRGVHGTRFLKYIWPFFNIINERIKAVFGPAISQTANAKALSRKVVHEKEGGSEHEVVSTCFLN